MSATVRQSASDIFRSNNVKLPIAGKIRPGIQVLTKAAKENIPNAEKIYSEGVDVGASFDDIEKKLKAANPKFTRSPLTPRNSEYFRCSQEDFDAPGAAQEIMNRYGEDRGDGLKLYSFPVVFPVDEIPVVFNQHFEAWTARELKYWSEYNADGELMCKTRQDIKAKNARRRFGGRPIETLGPCDPNQCDVFADEKCNHNCSLLFYIPGCVGVGLIELSFSSIYAAMQIQQTLDMVLNGLGRIKGVYRQQPIFTISKTLENVSRIDHKKGEVTRANQHIIRLTSVGIDMTEVFIAQEQQAAGLPAPASGSTELAITPMVSATVDTDHVNDCNDESRTASSSVEPDIIVGETESPGSFDQASGRVNRSDPTEKDQIAALRKDLSERADALNLTVDEFSQWGVNKFGQNAFRELESLRLIDEAVQHAEATGDITEFKPMRKKQEVPF